MKTKINNTNKNKTINWSKKNLLQHKHNKYIIVINTRLEETEGFFIGIIINSPNKEMIGSDYVDKKEDFELFEGEITLSNE